MMKNLALPEKYSGNLSSKPVAQFSGECWFDDSSILDIDCFVKTLSGIKAKGVRPDLIGSIITHYASKWLPELSREPQENGLTSNQETSPESINTSWMKKRFFLETLVGILPPEKDSLPCNFLLRLLKNANIVGVEFSFRDELEKRISKQLEQATLMELLIPSFSHTCGTLLDVGLVVRLVKGFVESEGVRNGSATIKVAKLVDSYLAEAALDLNLKFTEFMALARALPAQARAMDDGLYLAIDTYFKTHTDVSKEERKALCKLIDFQKLSVEGSLHAGQNERLPVRAVIKVLLSEQSKLNCQIDWSRSFSTTRSPNIGLGSQEIGSHSKRHLTAQEMEIKKLKEDVLRLQSQCFTMQGQIEKLLKEEEEKKKKKKGFFSWKKLGITPFMIMTSVVVADKIGESREMKGDSSIGRQTPVDRKTKMIRGKSQHRSRSMS